MTSGIYKLTFNTGKFYIGKSNNIERRWTEHFAKFNKGTAAKNMQHEFNISGDPKAEILLECHEDHIDLMEALFIDRQKCDRMLNATFPNPPSDKDADVFIKWGAQVLPFSTAEHIRYIVKQAEQIQALEIALEDKEEEFDELEIEYSQNLEDIKNGTALAVAEKELDRYFRRSQELETELAILKSKTWFQRLFNL